MIRREYKRLAKGNPLFGSLQGEQWFLATELGETPWLTFARGGMTTWREDKDLIVGWELPWSLPINGTGLAPRAQQWRYVFEGLR